MSYTTIYGMDGSITFKCSQAEKSKKIVKHRYLPKPIIKKTKRHK